MALPDYAMKHSSFPELYERFLVEPLFRPWAEILLQRAKLNRDDRVLDLACGTGVVARLVKARLGDDARVVGVDLSPQMLAVARTAAPNIEWREGNAAALPVSDDEKFDVLICQQGLQFFPDKPASAREMKRVLAPGGRIVVAAWRSDDEVPLFRELRRVAERHLGPIADARHGFGDASVLRSLLTDAGFKDVNVETVSRTSRFADGSVLLRLNTMALAGMSAAGKAMSDEERARVVETIIGESGEALKPFSEGAAVAFEMSTNIATATA